MKIVHTNAFRVRAHGQPHRNHESTEYHVRNLCILISGDIMSNKLPVYAIAVFFKNLHGNILFIVLGTNFHSYPIKIIAKPNIKYIEIVIFCTFKPNGVYSIFLYIPNQTSNTLKL